MDLFPLIGFLAQIEPQTEIEWNGWRVARVTSGWNNLIYRATNSEFDYAVKFTRRDNRDRAGREFKALTALRDIGLNIAPAPVLLEQNRYRLPVVVQSWLEGRVRVEPPANDDEWLCLLQHYATLNRVTPQMVRQDLTTAVVTMRTADEGKERVRQQCALLPDEALSVEVKELIARLEVTRFEDWQPPPIALCRVDPNITNFICRENAWASVDWENAGWGDAAFEIADLIVHPAYMDVPADRWAWVIEQYCRLMKVPEMAQRIHVYYQIMLVWWVVRFARYLYDLPRGNDRRLVDQPHARQAAFQTKYAHYWDLALRAYA